MIVIVIVLWLVLVAVWGTGFGYLVRVTREAQSLGWWDLPLAILAAALWPLLLIINGAYTLFLEDR